MKDLLLSFVIKMNFFMFLLKLKKKKKLLFQFFADTLRQKCMLSKIKILLNTILP